MGEKVEHSSLVSNKSMRDKSLFKSEWGRGVEEKMGARIFLGRTWGALKGQKEGWGGLL